MKITVYGLVGLVKDGKAPKKIKDGCIVFEYNKEINDYVTVEEIERGKKGLLFSIDKDLLFSKFDNVVEILPEENDRWEDIKEIVFLEDEESSDKINRNFEIFANEFNKLIKNQKYLKERLEEK